MFCSKCGKEINNEAVICPNCGCATSNYQPPVQNAGDSSVYSSVYSSDYPIIKKFADEAQTIKILGIIAAILMFGIGIIVSIIVWTKKKNYPIPEITTTNPNEVAEYEAAKRKYELGFKLSKLPIIGIAISIAILFIMLGLSAF